MEVFTMSHLIHKGACGHSSPYSFHPRTHLPTLRLCFVSQIYEGTKNVDIRLVTTINFLYWVPVSLPMRQRLIVVTQLMVLHTWTAISFFKHDIDVCRILTIYCSPMASIKNVNHLEAPWHTLTSTLVYAWYQMLCCVLTQLILKVYLFLLLGY